MARRCGKYGCGPRANWWKRQLGVDYYSGSGGETEYLALLAAATGDGDTVPTSSVQKNKENTFIRDLKNAGLWDKALYGIMCHTVGGDKNYVSRNWINPTQKATVTAADLIEDGGLLAADGIDTGFDLAGVTQNNVTYCASGLFEGGVGNRALFGVGEGTLTTSDCVFFNPRNASNVSQYNVSDKTGLTFSNDKAVVRIIIARDGETKYYSVNGGAFVTGGASAFSTVTTPKNLYLLAMNGSSVVFKNPSGGIRYFWIFDGKLSDAEASAFDTAILKYLTPTNDLLLFADPFNRTALGGLWTIESSAGATISSNRLRLVGTGSDDQTVVYTPLKMCFEDFTITAKIISRTAAGATNYGIAFGVRSFSDGSRRDNCMQLANSTGNVGKWFFNTSTGDFVVKGSGGGFTIVQDTEYQIRVSLSKRTWTAQLLSADGNNVHSEYIHTTASTEDEVAALGGTNLAGCFAIWSIGGTWDIDDYKVVAPKEVFQAKYLFAGDSITRGSSSTTPALRYVSVFEDSADGSVVCFANGSNVTEDILDTVNLIIELRPENVLLMIGGNDILLAVTSATYEANYTSVRDQLVAAGINVIHLLATPRSGTDIRALNTFIQTNFVGDTIIDTFTPLKGTGDYDLAAAYDSGDGTHPNDAGHALIASTILAAL